MTSEHKQALLIAALAIPYAGGRRLRRDLLDGWPSNTVRTA